MHDEIDHKRKNNCHYKSGGKAPERKVPTEHDGVGLRHLNYEFVKPDSRHKADGVADERKQNVFAENIGGNFAVVKAENLYCGNFAYALRNIDVGKVIKHHKRQRGGGDPEGPFSYG